VILIKTQIGHSLDLTEMTRGTIKSRHVSYNLFLFKKKNLRGG
jgi:hypothetical protein